MPKKSCNSPSEEARLFKHEYVGTEHGLLGLMEEGSGVTPGMLKLVNYGRRVRAWVELHEPGPSVVAIGEVRHTAGPKTALNCFYEASRILEDASILPVHSLFGL